jgi:hypothetical protein
MDKNEIQAHRIYDVVLWLNVATRPQTANLQLLRDIEEVQRLMEEHYKDVPEPTAQKQAAKLNGSSGGPPEPP